jgi:hypothetical protein
MGVTSCCESDRPWSIVAGTFEHEVEVMSSFSKDSIAAIKRDVCQRIDAVAGRLIDVSRKI